MSIPEQVADTLSSSGLSAAARRLPPPGSRLIVAVSGGPDSLVLLHVLAEMGLWEKEQLLVAHLDHMLRPDSGADGRFVQAIAEEWGLPCRLAQVDVARLARDNKMSVEEAAREARYRFLAEVARAEGSRFVAAGHNADDQAETVLMHLLRGSGLAGLRGMATAGPLPGAGDLTLLRPLLGVSRAEIEDYCREHGLSPVSDASNEDPSFFRNRLRAELLPVLEQYSPQVNERLATMGQLAAADYELVEIATRAAWDQALLQEGDGWTSLSLSGWTLQPMGIRRALLRQAVARLAPGQRDVPFRSIELAREIAELGHAGREASLPGDVNMLIEASCLLFTGADVEPPEPDLPLLAEGQELSLDVPGQVQVGGWILEAIVGPAEGEGMPDFWTVAIDGDCGPLTVRSAAEGERFQPQGLDGHSSRIARTYINEKIPVRLRSRWPVVANAKHVVWLTGVRVDERARAGGDDDRVVTLRLRRVD